MGNIFDIKEQKLRDAHAEFVKKALDVADDYDGDATEVIAEHAAKTEAAIEKINRDRLNFKLYHGQ